MSTRMLLAALILPLYGFVPQDAPAAKPEVPSDASETYPPLRHKTVLLAFSIADDAKADVLRKALADLSTKETDCVIAYGPVHTSARPSREFIAVEAPATVDTKDVLKAMKRGSPGAELLSWTCFQSEDRTLGRGLGGGMPGLSPRDFVLGMSNDLRWVEAQGGFVEFFFTPGKLTAEMIADRFHKLAQPFGVKDVGAVVVESFTWPLAEPLDEAACKRAEKALAKLDGVKSAKLDVKAKSLEVKVALDGLHRSGPPRAMPGERAAIDGADSKANDSGREIPRLIFDTNPILDVLEKEHIGVVAPAKTEEKPEGAGKKGG